MSNRSLARRLTSSDAAFLYFEKPRNPMHIGSCNVYEGHVTREDVIRILEPRMHLLPRYRQKVVFPPFGLGHPTWEDDSSFDLARHVEEERLPPPGDDRVLSEFGGHLFEPQLDRGRPLWKLIVLHGRQDGNTAVLWKVHHAMVDGVSGIELTMVMHDLKPDAEPPAAAAAPWTPKAAPDPLTLLQDAVRHRLTETVAWWTDQSFLLLRPADLASSFGKAVKNLTSSAQLFLRPAPPMPFNRPLSGELQFVWAVLSFTEVRAIRSALGGTVNDVVLAVIAGGLGRYLRKQGHATEGVEVRAMCPVSMRKEDERGTLGNLVSVMIVPLYVGILDPVERLRAERAAMDRLKAENQAGALFETMGLADRIPPALQAAGARLDLPNRLINTVSTNVPGPQVPLYLGGHRLLALSPIPPCAGNVGLVNGIVSYDQKLTIGTTVDPKLVPDPWLYASSLEGSFAELLEAARSAPPGQQAA